MMIPTALIIIEQFFRQLIFANCLFSRLQVSGRRQGELSHSLVSCQLSTFWRRIFVTLLLTKMHSAICCCFLVPSVVSNNVALKKLFKCLTKEPHDGAKLKQIFSQLFRHHVVKQISAHKCCSYTTGIVFVFIIKNLDPFIRFITHIYNLITDLLLNASL